MLLKELEDTEIDTIQTKHTEKKIKIGEQSLSNLWNDTSDICNCSDSRGEDRKNIWRNDDLKY